MRAARNRLLAATLAVLMPPLAGHAETFMCCEGIFFTCSANPDLTLTADHGAGVGAVAVRGLPKTETSFKLWGLDRYWIWLQDFRSIGNGFMFRIKPGEDGFHYEFDLDDELETAMPSSFYGRKSAG